MTACAAVPSFASAGLLAGAAAQRPSLPQPLVGWRLPTDLPPPPEPRSHQKLPALRPLAQAPRRQPWLARPSRPRRALASRVPASRLQGLAQINLGMEEEEQRRSAESRRAVRCVPTSRGPGREVGRSVVVGLAWQAMGQSWAGLKIKNKGRIWPSISYTIQIWAGSLNHHLTEVFF